MNQVNQKEPKPLDLYVSLQIGEAVEHIKLFSRPVQAQLNYIPRLVPTDCQCCC